MRNKSSTVDGAKSRFDTKVSRKSLSISIPYYELCSRKVIWIPRGLCLFTSIDRGEEI